MFKNHLKIAFRNIRKHKGFAFINVTGLAVGIGCCLMILLYIQDELSFDSFHSKKDRIYRVDKTVLEEGGQIVHTAEMPGNFAPTLVQDYPEVESAVRLRPWWDAMLISRSEKRLKIANVIITDSTFFEIFDFALLRGDPHKALAEPLSVVITEEVARQFFGDADPMGQVLEGLYDMPLKITGIAKAAPTHSHIRFDVLISWSTSTNSAYADRFDWMNRWITQAVFTYILLAPEASPTALEAKFPAFMKTYMARWADKYFPYLQPLGDIHLRSTGIQFQHNHNAGNILLIYVFAVTAVLILAIACINFMNLTTARATRRAKEVGMRKVVGAEKKHLIRQFLSESMLFAMLALAIAIVIIEFALPFFNELTQRQLGFSLTNNPLLFAGMFFITLLAGIAAGSYPAFVLSAFRPVEVFKGSQGSTLRGVFSRKILVIAQFFFAIILIVAAAVVYRQMDYMQSKDLGFKKDQVIIIPFDGSSLRSQAHSFKNAVLQNLDVLSAALTSGGPGLGATGFDMLPEGWAISERHGVPTIGVDFDFIDTYKLRIA
ncbi:MAG: ABC transporter permease, partial [bacterium]